jgi:hypothetical protein
MGKLYVTNETLLSQQILEDVYVALQANEVAAYAKHDFNFGAAKQARLIIDIGVPAMRGAFHATAEERCDVNLQARRRQSTLFYFDSGVGRWHENAEMMHRRGPLRCLVAVYCDQAPVVSRRSTAPARPWRVSAALAPEKPSGADDERASVSDPHRCQTGRRDRRVVHGHGRRLMAQMLLHQPHIDVVVDQEVSRRVP